MVDFLSLFFILATAANLALLWRGGNKNAGVNERRKVPSDRTAQAVEAIRSLAASDCGTRQRLSGEDALKVRPVPSAPLRKGPGQNNPYEEAQRMIAQGTAVGEIARVLRIPKGEFELFLKLNRYRKPFAASVLPVEMRS